MRVNPFDGLTKLFTSRVDGYAPMDDKFVQPDKAETAKSLRLEKRGEEQGALNLPSAESKTFDVVEREIINAVSGHVNACHIDVSNNVRSYEDRLAGLHLLHGLGNIKAETTKALGDFKVLVSTWNQHLSTRIDALRASYKELRSFQLENDLEHRPFKEIESRWVHSSAILGAWFVETAGNTFFLSSNDEMGIIGGTVAAAFVAAINVAFAVAAGRFAFPLTNLKRPGPRWFGIALVAVWAVLFAFLWNLAAAHFRDVKSAGIPNPEAAVLASMSEGLFSLDSLYSWGLLAIGILAAAITARAGYLMDDPYPGYGAIGHKHTERCREYAALVAEAQEDIVKKRDQAIGAAQAVKDEVGIQMRERGRIHAAYGHLVRRFKEHQTRLEDFANYLLEVYRNANRRARTGPVPAHFNDRFEIERIEVPPVHEEAIRAESIAAAERALDDAIEAISAAFDKSIDSFIPLEELKKDLEHAAV
jgi:hypothetical protein